LVFLIHLNTSVLVLVFYSSFLLISNGGSHYSWFSSPLHTPDRLRIVFNVVHVPAGDGRHGDRRGVCTGWLDRLTNHAQSLSTGCSSRTLLSVVNDLSVGMSGLNLTQPTKGDAPPVCIFHFFVYFLFILYAHCLTLISCNVPQPTTLFIKIINVVGNEIKMSNYFFEILYTQTHHQ